MPILNPDGPFPDPVCLEIDMRCDSNSECCNGRCLLQPSYGRGGTRYCSSWSGTYKCADSSMCDSSVSIPYPEFIYGAVLLVSLVLIMLFCAYKIGKKRANKLKLKKNIKQIQDTDLDEEKPILYPKLKLTKII
eukprot:UN13262